MAIARELLDSCRRGETIDLRNPQLFADPDLDELFEWLRDNAPAYRDANGLVYVTRFTDVCAIEHNATLYSSTKGTVPLIDMSTDESMINLDDPQHATHRRLIVRRFTPRGMKPHNRRIQDVVTTLIDRFAPTGECDLVADFAAVLPAMVICELLGFPSDRWQDCERWARLTLASANYHWDDPTIPDFMGGFVEFIEACTELLALRRADPQDDLISLWAHTEIDGVAMSDKRVLEEALLVLDGGAETTRSVIGFGAIALCENPVQRQLLRDDPSAIEKTATEELIRWVTPINLMRRTATEDHVLHDLPIAAGDEVLLLYRSANRDPRSIDRPNQLDVMRTGNLHVAFGFGTHYCVGANLARFEIRTSFEELLRRLPDFRFAAGTRPEVLPGMFTRGLGSFPLEFTPEKR